MPQGHQPGGTGNPVARAMSVVTTVARQAGGLLGLVDEHDREQVEEFRRAQAEAAKVPDLMGKLKAAGARVTAARLALSRGELFENRDARFAVERAEFELSVVAAALRRSQEAHSAAVGLCPCPKLQGRRRELLEGRASTLARIAQLKRTREGIVDEIRRGEVGLTRDWHPDELARVARRLREDKTQLARIDTELAALEADRLNFDTELDSVRDAMRAFKV